MPRNERPRFSTTELFALRHLAATVLLVACAVAASDLGAQSPGDSPRQRFEVASVKPTLSPYEAGREAARLEASGKQAPAISFGIQTYPGGRLTAYATLRSLIARAYDVKDYDIDGGPRWIGEDYFVINARAGGDATAAEFNEMLKALLADRFGLRTHNTTRLGQVHALVRARPDGKLGSALKPTSPECLAQIKERTPSTPPSPPPPPARPPRPGPPDATPRCGTITFMNYSATGARTLSASGQSLSTLVDHLTGELSATVVDRTGLDGRFDFVVEFETERLTPGFGRGGLDPNSTESPKPPLRIAIERQLGLKLESVEGQVPILVVDAAERPMPD